MIDGIAICALALAVLALIICICSSSTAAGKGDVEEIKRELKDIVYQTRERCTACDHRIEKMDAKLPYGRIAEKCDTDDHERRLDDLLNRIFELEKQE